MSTQSYSRQAFWISLGAAAVIIVGLVRLDPSLPEWVPQVVVTLAGLVGISWFAGRRLDLFDKGIQQRQDAATDQLRATERGNLNGAFREAVHMMATNSLPSILARNLSTTLRHRRLRFTEQSLLLWMWMWQVG